MNNMLNIIVSGIIFFATFYFVITEKINRTIISFVGAVVMVTLGTILGFYSQRDAIGYLDLNTLGLLIGMMIIVSILKTSGFFTYLAIKTAKISGDKPWQIMVVMGLATGFISMFVDNVTTIILVSPVTVVMADILAINPLPILLTEILLSNVGGVATLIGDPPNIIIGSASGYTFNRFLVKLFPITVGAMIVSILALCIIFRKELAVIPKNIKAIKTINEKVTLTDVLTLKKCLLSLAVVLALFLLQERLGFKPAFVALLGAALTLLLVRPDPDKVLLDVEWSAIVFFASIFILVGGVQNSGLLSLAADKLSLLLKASPAAAKYVVLWGSALMAPLFGALPFTASAVMLIKNMGAQGINIEPLWWMLAMGAGFGGNAIPIGTAAGIVGLAISKKTRKPITVKEWLLSGTIVTIVSLLFCSLFVWMY